jgi:tetratricopeptide (TPR) repeat protein
VGAGILRFRGRVWYLLASLLALAGSTVACWQRPVQVAAPDDSATTAAPLKSAAADETTLPVAHNPGYLGPQACAPCHARRVAEFQATRHFLACRLPQAESMPRPFSSGSATYRTRDAALRFEMSRGDDGHFLETAVRTTAAGEQRTSARIGLIYGSAGNADEIYFTWRGDGLYELPVAWLHPLQRWGEQPFDTHGTGDFSRTTTPRCLECHNTWFEHVAGSNNEFRRQDFILGVTCEKCHGPGREHVAFHQTHPEAGSAHAIVHPGHLPRARQMDVCGQCHSNAPKRRGPAFSYRPGAPLEEYFRTNLNRRREEDHVTDQVGYLRQSKCFQKDETLTCTTCHNPHRAAGPGNAGALQRSCLKCHQPADCAEQPRLPAAVRSDCVGCHMPRFTRIQVFFHTEEDQYVPPIRPHEHRIAVYPVARQDVLMTWYRSQADAQSRLEAERLTKALVAHWLAEAEQYRREYRFLAAIGAMREALRLEPAPATQAKLQELTTIQAKLDADWFTAIHQVDESLTDKRRLPDALHTLEGILRIKPNSARTHGKLGGVYADMGRNDLAVEHLQAVAQYDPDSDYGYVMLGWMAYSHGQYQEAIDAYRRADEIEPYNAKTNYQMGLAWQSLERLPQARAAFERALTINPNYTEACYSLSAILRRQGDFEEAFRLAKRSARLTHYQNSAMLVHLAETALDAGHHDEAEDAAAEALAAAQGTDADSAAQLRRRVEEVRARRFILELKKE